jgi:predicted acetyltransferase
MTIGPPIGRAQERRAEPRIAGFAPEAAHTVLDLDRWAFPNPDFSLEPDAVRHALGCFEWDRTRGAYLTGADGIEQLAGINSVYSLELPVPGGALPCAGLTWVSVHPLHRRRGVLTAMIRDHLQAAHERGEPVSALHAAEAPIYGRFGYGVASHYLYGTVPRGAALHPVPGADEVRMRLEHVDAARHAHIVGDCYEAARRHRPGMVSRTSPAQRQVAVSDPVTERAGAETLKIFIAEADDDGPARGYALFRRTNTATDRRSAGVVRIHEVVTRDPAAARALWGRLLDLDLTSTVELDKRATDDPLFSLLVDPRVVHTARMDGLWVRLVDLPVALTGRRYAAELNVVIEVRDELCPWNAGRWRLSTGLDGADRADCTPSTDPATFSLDVRELGSAWLGSVSLTALADAGLITVHDRPGFIAAAHAFGWPVAAHCSWTF